MAGSAVFVNDGGNIFAVSNGLGGYYARKTQKAATNEE
jgi:hypothetical protein